MIPSTTRSDLSVLVVEDEVIVAVELGEILRDIGFGHVAVAHSLKGAEREVDARLPDLAILDINLGNGERTIDLGRHLSDQGTRVVFATGYNREELTGVENYAYLEKPLIGAELERRLDAILRL